MEELERQSDEDGEYDSEEEIDDGGSEINAPLSLTDATTSNLGESAEMEIEGDFECGYNFQYFSCVLLSDWRSFCKSSC